MANLTRNDAKAILEKVLGYSKAETCEANLSGSTGGNIRYARNTVTTGGAVRDMNLVVQSSYGQRSATTTINEFDDVSLQKVVRRAEALAKLAPENEEFMPPLGPQGDYAKSVGYFERTAAINPDFRAQVAAHSIEPSRKKKLVAAGYLEDSYGFQALMNSKGLFAYHRSSDVNFSVTVRSEDGTGSGYVERDYNDIAKFDSAAVSQIAIDKAAASVAPRAIEPGKYTVILEPSASVGLLGYMFGSLDARQADEGRSFLSKKGGGTKLGEKMVDERVTIFSDPSNAEIPVAGWSGDGQVRRKMAWVEKGVVKNLFYSRYWAKKQEKEAVPFPANGIMLGGDESTAQMIANTEKGVLVTRTWYIRMVDPQTLLLTGLTRDGTFFIEKGKIAFPIKNMRFNESPIIMLNNIESLGKPRRMQGNLIPPMKIRDFTFSSSSDAV